MRSVNCILLKESSFDENDHPHFTYVLIYILSIINSIGLAGKKTALENFDCIKQGKRLVDFCNQLV